MGLGIPAMSSSVMLMRITKSRSAQRCPPNLWVYLVCYATESIPIQGQAILIQVCRAYGTEIPQILLEVHAV